MTAHDPLFMRLATRAGLDLDAYLDTIMSQCMPSGSTEQELRACVHVASKLDLDPLLKEILFTRAKQGHVQPLVGMDGWITLAQRHPSFKGYTFKEILSPTGEVIACQGTFHRADWAEPMVITEYMAECKGTGDGWAKTPIRMLRNRTLTQGVRLIVGAAGVMEPDEFAQWQARDASPRQPAKPAPAEDEIPDFPDFPEAEDAASDTTSGAVFDEAGFMMAFEAALAAAQDESTMQEVCAANDEIIVEHGLEQACGDILDRHMERLKQPAKEPATVARVSTQETPENQAQLASLEPEKEPAKMSDQAAIVLLGALRQKLALLHNASRIKAQWNAFDSVYRQLSPDRQAEAARLRDEALARVRRAEVRA